MFPVNSIMQQGLLNAAQQGMPQQSQQSPGLLKSLGTGIQNFASTGQWSGGQPVGLMANPLFNAGMGLLASAHDRSINPAQAVLSGLANARNTRMQDEEKKRVEDYRKELAAIFEKQARGMATTQDVQRAQQIQREIGSMTPEQEQRAQSIGRIFGGQ